MLPEVERFHKWLTRKFPHTSTALHYTSDVNLFFAWANKSVPHVTLRDIDRFIEHCQSAHHASATINRRLAALRSFYDFLQLESDNAPSNPVHPRRHFIRLGTRLPRDVEDAELARLFAVIFNVRDRALFVLMLRCGLRVGEVRNLSLGDLYLQPTNGNLPRLRLHGKGQSERVVYLSTQACRALDDWLAIRPQVSDPAVFVNRFGHRFTVTGIQDRLAQYCHVAGMWITCHQFRHTLGRHLAEARVPVTTIQRLLGHKRLRTTIVYLHLSDRQVQADYDAAMCEIAKRFALKDGGR